MREKGRICGFVWGHPYALWWEADRSRQGEGESFEDWKIKGKSSGSDS